ncbi:anti-sigma factor domain-containing protein [Petrocella sp. FN5]|uniref:anti-sigma factor domain-containing protein n=1 Tax=Petrocella sp. FN5 TaxID=3032002 RepID=UPI0023DCE3EE|nr:anti-sigma factor domain-containing protein [Petrocella sp. FN5]MDF1617391.1 anti-sigma factor domain-containing protein [Petrocella sp. FN5]
MKIETTKPEAIRPEKIKTGSILEIKKTHAILLSEGMEFVCVRSKEGMAVGQTIYFFEEDIYSPTRIKFKNILLYAASLCLMLILLYSATHVVRIGQQIPISYGIVTLDINPSVEIHIDETGEVLRLIPLNEDGTKILLEEYKGMVLEEVLDILTENAVSTGFLLEDGAVMLTYTVVNQEVENRPEMSMDDEDFHEDDNYRRLETYMEKRRNHYKFLFVKGTEEGIKAAKSQGLSLGKYNLLNYVSEEISLEEIKEMSIKEIYEIIEETDFKQNHKNNLIFNRQDNKPQGPPDHSNASEQGQKSASGLNPQSSLEDESQNGSENESEKTNNNKRDKGNSTPNIHSNENSIKDKETPSNNHLDIEKTKEYDMDQKIEKEADKKAKEEVKIDEKELKESDKELKEETKVNDKEIKEADKEAEKEAEKELPSGEEIKSYNNMDNQEDITLEEVKEPESEKSKNKDVETRNANSDKSETKSNPGNSKK